MPLTPELEYLPCRPQVSLCHQVVSAEVLVASVSLRASDAKNGGPIDRLLQPQAMFHMDDASYRLGESEAISPVAILLSHSARDCSARQTSPDSAPRWVPLTYRFLQRTLLSKILALIPQFTIRRTSRT